MDSSIFDAGMAEHLQPLAVLVVRKKECHAVVHRDIAGAQQLTIAGVVSKRQNARILSLGWFRQRW
jgi:hypothetical protein